MRCGSKISFSSTKQIHARPRHQTSSWPKMETSFLSITLSATKISRAPPKSTRLQSKIRRTFSLATRTFIKAQFSSNNSFRVTKMRTKGGLARVKGHKLKMESRTKLLTVRKSENFDENREHDLSYEGLLLSEFLQRLVISFEAYSLKSCQSKSQFQVHSRFASSKVLDKNLHI